MKKEYGIFITLVLIFGILSGCTSVGKTVNIPADAQIQIGWQGHLRITSYDGKPVDWMGVSKDGKIFLKLPAGKHSLELYHYIPEPYNIYGGEEYYGVITFDFQPNRIYNIYCRVMVPINNINTPSWVEFTLTDVTDNKKFGYVDGNNSYKFGGGTKRLTTAEGFFSRGLTYYDRENYQTAISDFSEAIRLDPNFILAYKMRGFSYFSLEKDDFALIIADLDKVINESSSNDTLTFYIRGVAYVGVRDYEKAKADFGKVMELEKAYNEKELSSEVEGYLEQIRQMQGK